MSFIVIETQGGPEYAIIVTNENGENVVYDNVEDAEIEASYCQDGLVVEI